MQPTFKHVPPNELYFSTSAVFIPNCAHLIAATYPPGPAPITVTSYFITVKKFYEFTNESYDLILQITISAKYLFPDTLHLAFKKLSFTFWAIILITIFI